MKQQLYIKKHLLLICLLLFSSFSFSQVTQIWERRYNETYESAQAIAVDKTGNVYVTGSSGGNRADYATIKYDAAGNQLWVARYNGPGNGIDEAHAIAVDKSGSVYVSGYSDGNGTSADCATIKYDSNGNQLWEARYNGPGNGIDYAEEIILDATGSLYVTGSSVGDGTSYDYITIRYDTDGWQQWVARFNGSGNSADGATAIAIDAAGNVYVAGFCEEEGRGQDYTTIKYSGAGNQLWVANYNGPDNGNDGAWGIAVDKLGQVYVTGGKNVHVVTGFSLDYATVKYDAAGNQLWVAGYNGPGNGTDIAKAIKVDAAGNVFVTGGSAGIGIDMDYATLKYDNNGKELWAARFSGTATGFDGAEAIAMDVLGNVYVTGRSEGNGTSADHATIKYDTNGNQLWVARYNGPDNGMDGAEAIAVDDANNVYVTGFSEGTATTLDYLTIKYSQAAPLRVDAGADKTLYLGYGPACVTLAAKASGGTPPYRFSWSPGGSTVSSIQVCPVTTTTYTVTVADANGETASDQVTVYVIDVRCGNKLENVLVCHKGKPLCIASSAVAAHLKHGDRMGNCAVKYITPVVSNYSLVRQQNSDRTTNKSKSLGNWHLQAYPNPVLTSAFVEFRLPYTTQASVTLVDISGKTCQQIFSGKADGQVLYKLELRLQSLTRGVYFVRLLTGDGKLITYQLVYQ